MSDKAPVGVLHEGFSSPGAVAPPWDSVLRQLDRAETFWLSSVRPDRRPHVTPLLGLWAEWAFWFCTGPGERKAGNLASNGACVVTTGRNGLDGLDVVIEGTAAASSAQPELDAFADGLEQKYGWRMESPGGTWAGLGDGIRRGEVLVYRVVPDVVFAFEKGTAFSQTRWTAEGR